MSDKPGDGTITVCGYSFPARIMGVPDYPSRSFQHEGGRRTVPWEDWCDIQQRLKEAVEVIANLQAQSLRSEALPTMIELAMRGAPMIHDAVMRAMRDHYWDSLEPQKELVLKHIEGALRWLGQSPPQNEKR